MESPPPYTPPRPRGTNVGLIIALVIGGLALCCLLGIGLMAGGGYMMFNKSKPMVTCIMAFEDLRKSVGAYAKAHDGKLPDAANWQTEVLPYYKAQLKKHQPEQDKLIGSMPAEGVWGCETPKARTGIAFNSDLSGKKLADIESPDTTILLYEVEGASMNAHGPYKPRPPKSGPPFMMGEPRPWIEVTVSGNTNMKDGSGSSMVFDTDDRGRLRVKPHK